jgi:hypothetical protein
VAALQTFCIAASGNGFGLGRAIKTRRRQRTSNCQWCCSWHWGHRRNRRNCEFRGKSGSKVVGAP